MSEKKIKKIKKLEKMHIFLKTLKLMIFDYMYWDWKNLNNDKKCQIKKKQVLSKKYQNF